MSLLLALTGATGWIDGETVVFSFSDGSKSLAAGEIGVASGDSPKTSVSTKEGHLTGSTFTIITNPTGTTGPHFGNDTLSFAPHISTESMYDAWFQSSGGGNSVVSITAMTAGVYDIVFAASRNVAAGDGSRVTDASITVGTGSSLSQTFDAANPASGSVAPHVTFSSITPASGEIRISFAASSGASFGYLGAIAITKQAATTNYSLTCDAGSYSVSGQVATLTRAVSLDCAAGSYAVSGQTATLSVARQLACNAGAYAVSGQAATLTRTVQLDCVSGSYSLAGQDASLVYTPVGGVNYSLTCDAGAYSVTGQVATFARTTSLNCLAGSYVLTGQPITFIVSGGGRSKLYNPNLVDHPAWAWNTKKAEVKPEEPVIVELTEEEINLPVELPEQNSVIEEEVKALEVQLAALNIHVEKMQSYDKLFKLEEELRIEQERIAQEEEEYAIALCIAMLM